MKSPSNENLEEQFAALSGKRVAVVCVGNPLRGDDGFGQAVAARLESDKVFDADAVPENVLPKVERLKPELVLFVDAADFGAEPGALRLVSPDELAQGDFSTHAAPLSVATDYLKMSCGARSMLLAVQARTTEFGSVMSVEVVKAVDRAVALIRQVV
jgi:hydrogenase 3 maturation protease